MSGRYFMTDGGRYIFMTRNPKICAVLREREYQTQQFLAIEDGGLPVYVQAPWDSAESAAENRQIPHMETLHLHPHLQVTTMNPCCFPE